MGLHAAQHVLALADDDYKKYSNTTRRIICI